MVEMRRGTARRRALIAGIALALALGLAALLLVSLPTETERVEDTIQRFVHAYNSGDGEALLSCVDPQWAETVRGQMANAGDQLGLDEALLWRFMPLLYQWMKLPAFNSMEVAVGDIAIDGALASASVVVTLHVAGLSQSLPCTIALEKSRGGWYLASVRLL